VLLPLAIWRELLRFRQGAGLDAPLFPSRRGGGHLHQYEMPHSWAEASERHQLLYTDRPTRLQH